MHPDIPFVTLVGSGTGVPAPDRGSPCLMVHYRNELTLLDLGPGAVRRLSGMGVPHSLVKNILITHFHPDHTADLIHFLFATRYPPVLEKRSPFRIIGPEGLLGLMNSFEQAYGRWIRLPGDILSIEEMPLDASRVLGLEHFTVSSARTAHTGRSLAYRLDFPAGSSLVYSGDTGPCEALITLAKGCDLLVLECSFPDGEEMEGHLTPGQAGEIASAAGAKKLVLVHFYPEVLPADISGLCRRRFQGELIIGRDRLTVSI